MKILKLSATDSTNSYLRNLLRKSDVENWTVVTAEYQTKGKGQFSNKWISEEGKNLTFSILVKFEKLSTDYQFYLNYSVSIAIYNVLKYYISERITVKWPNDILSANKKICGILIKCVLKNTHVNHAIIGVGLNVNQTEFPSEFSATSIKNIIGHDVDRDELLQKILLEMQYQFILINRQRFDEIKQQYESILYRKGTPSMFVDVENNKFLGKITGISLKGKLQVELDDESVKEFDLKEIRFA